MIGFFGDLTWTSKNSIGEKYNGSVHKAVRAKINYLIRKDREDLLYHEGLEWKKWKEIIDRELESKYTKNPRIYGSFLVVLPNFLKNDIEGIRKLLKEFMKKEIGTEHFGFALHCNKGSISGMDNLHAHVIFSPRGQDGKKLRIGPNDLKLLHEKFIKLLESYTNKKVEKAPIKRKRFSF